MINPPPSSLSLFTALGLAPTPDRAAVRAAYAAIARTHHPDRGGEGPEFAAAAAAVAALTADEAALSRHAAAAVAEAAAAAAGGGALPAATLALDECVSADSGGVAAPCRCGGAAVVGAADATALVEGRVGAVHAACDGCSAVYEVVRECE